MPSPIAHSVSGYALAKFLDVEKPKTLVQHHWSLVIRVFYPVFVAVAADFDFAIEFITGLHFHRGPTHSLLFAAGFSAVCALVFTLLWKISYKHVFWFTLVVYGSHLVLDYFTYGGSGMKLLWPLSAEYFKSPVAIFPGIHHSRGLFYIGHLEFLWFESVYSILLLAGLRLHGQISSRNEAS